MSSDAVKGGESRSQARATPPPITTRSRSQSAVAEAIPAARARADRSNAASATGSSSRAEAASASPLDAAPVQPLRSAQRTIAGPEVIVSTQPREPHGQGSPLMSTTVCPMCPAFPVRPAYTRPSRMRPPPTPVETTMPSMARTPRPAP